MSEDEQRDDQSISGFWDYTSCPRGLRSRRDHIAQNLVHAIVENRRVCAGAELLTPEQLETYELTETPVQPRKPRGARP